MLYLTGYTEQNNFPVGTQRHHKSFSARTISWTNSAWHLYLSFPFTFGKSTGHDENRFRNFISFHYTFENNCSHLTACVAIPHQYTMISGRSRKPHTECPTQHPQNPPPLRHSKVPRNRVHSF